MHTAPSAQIHVQSCLDLLHLQLDRTVSPIKCSWADVEDIRLDSFGVVIRQEAILPLVGQLPLAVQSYPNLINYCLPISEASIRNSQFKQSTIITVPLLNVSEPSSEYVSVNYVCGETVGNDGGMIYDIQSHREDGRPRAQDRRLTPRSLPLHDFEHCTSVCSHTQCTRANTITSSSSCSSVIPASERSDCDP